MINTIIKRDGREMPFKSEKIVRAILAAMEKCDIYDLRTAKRIASKIASLDLDVIEIEKVQDMVEVELMASKYKEVAKEYITYRRDRSKSRQMNSDLTRKINDIISCKNIVNSNANVDEYSFGARKNESANVIQKDIALHKDIRPEVAQAHLDYRVYKHDLSEYGIGMHNCLFIDLKKLLEVGFVARNADVRPANCFATACQLVAVIFQIQSQVQFGGVASAHIDYDLAPYVKKSFIKHYKIGIEFLDPGKQILLHNIIEENKLYSIEDKILIKFSRKAYKYAIKMLEKEGLQSAQGMYHNLGTLESRAGAQVPFTSINFGRDTSPEGRKVTEWLLKASIDGIGKYNSTPIFPIGVFQYKKGVNDKPGTPNYDLKLLAIQSLSKRIYPNIVNCDWSQNQEDPNDIDTNMATMGCRTLIGYDRHGMGYKKVGRGNVAPATINLPKIGIKHGICTGERHVPDTEGFFDELEEILKLTEISLVDRFYHICSQNPKSAPFMYINGTIADSEKVSEHGIYEAMKHGTLAIGFIGVSEMCYAMFGNDHTCGLDYINNFAKKVIERISTFAKEASNRNDLNFGCYSTPK